MTKIPPLCRPWLPRNCAAYSKYYHRIVHLFFLNFPAAPEVSTLSLHDALPIWPGRRPRGEPRLRGHRRGGVDHGGDRKSTRLNSSHANTSYAVFCFKKKNSLAQPQHAISQESLTMNYLSPICYPVLLA